MTATKYTWTLGGASAIGAAHLRQRKPNQDAIGWSPSTGRGIRFSAAVSDGHGAAAYFRAETGSAFAIEAALNAFDWFFDDPHSEADVQDSLPEEIVIGWRNAIERHLKDHPLPDSYSGDPWSPYGATIVAAGSNGTLLLLCQIGDGDILLGWPDGRLTRPLINDPGLVGDQTYSLCMSDAQAHARVAVLPRSGVGWPDFILLATDGIAKSFADEASFRVIGERYRALALNDFKATLDAMPAWLEEVSRNGSGDDASLFLAVRREK
jgi:serine/threonine protein phosphatase PrpC